MAKFHQTAEECGIHNLELTSTPPFCNSILNSTTEKIPPVNSVSDNNFMPVEFYVKSDPIHYIDLSNSQVHMKLQILSEEGTQLDPAVKITPIANVAHSCFSDAQLYLNEQLVSDHNKMYSYTAYLLNTLSFGPHSKSASWMECELYAGDTSHSWKTKDPIAGCFIIFFLFL